MSWRVERGVTGFWPGNSQPCGRATRYQSRRRPSSTGDSMAWRSLRPLPCSTRSIMRLESISDSATPSNLMMSDLKLAAGYRASGLVH
jgi:hypothetical protein